jgi:hypothetical protein
LTTLLCSAGTRLFVCQTCTALLVRIDRETLLGVLTPQGPLHPPSLTDKGNIGPNKL